MPKTRERSVEELVCEDGVYKFKKTTKTYVFDQYVGQFGTFVPKGEPVVSYSTLAEHGLLKTQKMTVLIKRYAVNPQNLKPMSAIFAQEIEARIPNIPEFKNWYLTINKAIIKKEKLLLPSHFMIQKLDEGQNGTAQTLGFHDPIIKKIGPEKRISAKEAVRMVKEGLVGAILEEDLEGNFTRMGI